MLEHDAAAFHESTPGLTTPRPRIAADVAMPISPPARVDERASAKAVRASAPSADHLIDRAMRPVGSGPPITETLPALAVRRLLHDRAIAGRDADARFPSWPGPSARPGYSGGPRRVPSTTEPRVGISPWRSHDRGATPSPPAAGHRLGDRGPLPTGRHRGDRSGDPHDGADARRLFAGGAFVDKKPAAADRASRHPLRFGGLSASSSRRPIAWKAAASVLEHGRRRRGYLGIAGQPVYCPKAAPGVRSGQDNEAVLVSA